MAFGKHGIILSATFAAAAATTNVPARAQSYRLALHRISLIRPVTRLILQRRGAKKLRKQRVKKSMYNPLKQIQTVQQPLNQA